MISAEGDQLFVPRPIAMQSQWIKAMVESGMQESKTGIINLRSITSSMLGYIEGLLEKTAQEKTQEISDSLKLLVDQAIDDKEEQYALNDLALHLEHFRIRNVMPSQFIMDELALPEQIGFNFPEIALEDVHGNRVIGISGDKIISSSGAYLVKVGHYNYQFLKSYDYNIRLWNRDGSLVQLFKGHTDEIVFAQLVKDRLISASNDKTVRVWDIKTGTLLVTITLPAVLHSIFVENNTIVTHTDGVQVWDLHSGMKKFSFSWPYPITQIALHDNNLIIASQDILIRKNIETNETYSFSDTEDVIRRFHIVRDKIVLIVGENYDYIQVIDAQTFREIYSFDNQDEPKTTSFFDTRVAIANQNTIVIASPSLLMTLQLDTGKVIYSIKRNENLATLGIEVSGNLIMVNNHGIASDQGSIVVYNLENGQKMHVINKSARVIKLLNDNLVLLIDGHIEVINGKTGNQIDSITEQDSITDISVAGKLLFYEIDMKRVKVRDYSFTIAEKMTFQQAALVSLLQAAAHKNVTLDLVPELRETLSDWIKQISKKYGANKANMVEKTIMKGLLKE